MIQVGLFPVIILNKYHQQGSTNTLTSSSPTGKKYFNLLINSLSHCSFLFFTDVKKKRVTDIFHTH